MINMSNHNFKSPKIQAPLPLFVSNSDGSLRVRPELVQVKTEPDEATTKELEQELGISLTELRKCKKGEKKFWNLYLICHLGRDRWDVYKKYPLKRRRA